MPRPFFERARKIMSGEIPMATIGRTLGMTIAYVRDGEADFELEADMERHANPMGTLHGGVLCDLSDGAMGLGLGERAGRAEARVVKRGRTVRLVECDVRNADGDLVAHATSTIMTLRGEHAQGR